MEIKNLWTGNNTTQDSYGTADLTWIGTSSYQDESFKLASSGGQMINHLEFPDFIITSGTAFAFEGEVYAENFNSFPHITTPETGLGQDENHRFNFFFDFNEGLSQVMINNSQNVISWLYPIVPESVLKWQTFRLEYDGDVAWKLIINGTEIPVYNTVGDLRFNGAISSPHICVSNWEDFGDSYFLLKNFKFYN